MSDYDPTDFSAQSASEAEAQTQKRLAKDTEAGDFKWLMSSKRGRRIVWRLLDRTGVFRLSFNTNAMAMAFAEGNRNEGLQTLVQIHTICPELYSVMMKENANDNRNDEHGNHNDQ